MDILRDRARVRVLWAGARVRVASSGRDPRVAGMGRGVRADVVRAEVVRMDQIAADPGRRAGGLATRWNPGTWAAAARLRATTDRLRAAAGMAAARADRGCAAKGRWKATGHPKADAVDPKDVSVRSGPRVAAAAATTTGSATAPLG